MLGYFGELHPRALEALGADGPMIAFEVILDRIPEAKEKPTRAKPLLELSAFQPVSRDFAFIVDRGVKAGDIVRAAQGVDQEADHRRRPCSTSMRARASRTARSRSRSP